jgi:hypothetical protein
MIFSFNFIFSKLLAISLLNPGNLEKIILILLLIIVYKFVTPKKEEKNHWKTVFSQKNCCKSGKICPKNMISLGGYSFAT